MGEIHQVDDLYFSALFDAAAGDLFPISDEKYAYELHLQEALVSSAIASAVAAAAAAAPPVCKLPTIFEVKKERGESSNPIAAEIILTPTPTNTVVKKMIDLGESSNPIAAAEDQLMVCCKICMDSSPLEEMFENKNCLHVFCRECLGRYIGTKIQENISSVTCPEAECKVSLDPEDCQKIVPREVFERWGSALCEAMVLASQKFCYCPFKDCSALLLDDDVGGMVSQSECPSCRRLFCAICKVAWHSGVSCDEFQGLGADERSREDILLMEVANNNKWRRCSRCRFYVEKKDGCNHVTCRCGIEFCYGCGVQWSGSHTCGN